MSVARRQSSTTSLSKYAHGADPELEDGSLDFCNSFWGIVDGGVDVLFARMRGAGRSMDELKSFWKERVAIEDDYAKRLSKLAKQALGRDEIGELRNSLDTIRAETEKQAAAHGHLAQQIRDELERPTDEFCARQQKHKKVYQINIEKAFKTKQAQESYVERARDKYQSDCIRINSFTAQTNLVQGKDLEKLHAKLERAQQTVQANERDFANFAKALQDTVGKWEREWKNFADSCQDLEEDRIEFMKDTMWAYANAVSTVCVADDESCEKLRLSLETVDTETEMQNFVRDYSTGDQMPDPPAFVNFTSPDAITAPRQTARPARFQRQSRRAPRNSQWMSDRPPPPEREESPVINAAGVGAGGASAPNLNGSTTVSRQTTVNGSYNPSPAPSVSPQPRAGSAASGRPAGGDPIDPSNAGGRQQGGSSGVRPGDDNDPLAQQMASLIRSNTASRRPSASGQSVLSPPPGGAGAGATAQQKRDYRQSADLVVGPHPNAGGPGSRSTSPKPPSQPTANFMKPPEKRSSSPLPVEDVLANYQQSFPGEGKPISRQSSQRRSSTSHSQMLERPVSREGHAGIGAHGHSPSHSRSTSPAPALQPPPGMGGGRAAGRASPGVGITLDSSGQVSQDVMADRYLQEQQQRSQQQQAHLNRRQSVNTGVAPPPPQGVPPPPPVQQSPSPNMYGAPPQHQQPSPPLQMYSQQQQPHPYSQATPIQQHIPSRSFSTAPVPQQSPYPPPTMQPPPQPVQQHQPPPPQQQYSSYGATPVQQHGHGHGSSMSNGGYYQPPPPQQQPPPQPVYQPPPQPRAPSPPRGAPAPPTGQYTPDGQPILFYVKALYDYNATTEEEFDFQSGDIIAVTATPEDGWWSGMLLDDRRRVPGRTVFPSNFVHLF